MDHKSSFANTQAAGVAAFVSSIVGYSIVSRSLLSPWCRSSRASRQLLPCAASGPVVHRSGLLDLTAPSRRSKDYTNQLLANDIAIERAVKGVDETLYVYLQEDTSHRQAQEPDVLSPELRVYLSDLYGQLWDVCYLHHNLGLDVRILFSTPATATTTKLEVLLKPDLEVYFCCRDADVDGVEKQREAKGLPPLTFDWLDENIHVVLTTGFHYVEDEQAIIPHFNKVALGGTFDRLHNGHKKLLSVAASICEETLTIGITSTEMLASKRHAHQIESLHDRIHGVRAFLNGIFPDLKLDIAVLADSYGPPVHQPDFDALVVSSETFKGAVKINNIRASKGMKPLEIIVTRRTVSSLLSSTFVRDHVPPRRVQQRGITDG